MERDVFKNLGDPVCSCLWMRQVSQTNAKRMTDGMQGVRPADSILRTGEPFIHRYIVPAMQAWRSGRQKYSVFKGYIIRIRKVGYNDANLP